MKTFLIGVTIGFFLISVGNVHAYASTSHPTNDLFIFSQEYEICEMVGSADEKGFLTIYPFMLRIDDMFTLCWKRNGAEVASIATVPFSQVQFLLDDGEKSSVIFIMGGKSSLILKWIQGAHLFSLPASGIKIRTQRIYWEIFNKEL